MSSAARGGLLKLARPRDWRIAVRKLVVTEFVTVDGVVEDPGGSEGTERGGWAFEFDRGDEGDKFKLDETLEAEMQLLGRVTYDGFAAAWPSRTGKFADKMNRSPKYVVSSTLDDPLWENTTVINGEVAQEVSNLKQQPGGTILVHGSPQLVRTLLDHGLVDELRLMVFPVVLGQGKRLFDDGLGKSALQLVESRPVGPDGIVILIYRPAADSATSDAAA
jgi:dihydrofolate reductase